MPPVRSLDACLPTDLVEVGSAPDSITPRALVGRASRLLRRWHDGGSPISYGYSPLSIPGDSAAVTKYRPNDIENPHVIAAIAVVCTVVFLSLAAYLIHRIIERRRRAREEADSDATFQALEKGMGGGTSPPMELSAPSLWGKGLSFFNSERKRGPWTSVAETEAGKRELAPPRPALVRERSDVSLGESVKSGKSADSSLSSGSNGSSVSVGEFGAVNRLPRNKPGFQRKRSKLRLVQHDLDHVAEEEEDADGGPCTFAFDRESTFTSAVLISLSSRPQTPPRPCRLRRTRRRRRPWPPPRARRRLTSRRRRHPSAALRRSHRLRRRRRKASDRQQQQRPSRSRPAFDRSRSPRRTRICRSSRPTRRLRLRA